MDYWYLYSVVFPAVGFVTIFFLLLDALWNVINVIRVTLSPYLLTNYEQNLVKRYGSWALITGCTDGIGKEYSKELARKGFNLVLVSRSKDKLSTTASEIEAEYHVKTKIVVADFSKGPESIDIVRDEVGKLEIGILVNNVGTQYTYPMCVGEVPEYELWNIIHTNIGAVTLMTKVFIQGMIERKCGAIVNMSSGSELQPLPLMTVYAASKVYIRNFTRALSYEYSQHGITVQHLSPMFVNTKMNDFSQRLRKTSYLVPDAATYAKHAVNTLGILHSTTGYWSHGIQYFVAGLAPEWIRTIIAGKMSKNLRQEYFKMNKVVEK